MQAHARGTRGRGGGGGGELQPPLVAGPRVCAGRDTEPLAPYPGTALRSFESHQQCNDLWSLLWPGRCRGEPLLSAHDETSVFPR